MLLLMFSLMLLAVVMSDTKASQDVLWLSSDVDELSDMVMGILFIFDNKVSFLIDSGVMYLFMLYMFVMYVDYMSELLKSDLVVMIFMGDLFLVNNVCKDCMISMNDRELKVNLILFDIYDFDVMLGMDFLTVNYVSVDCFYKEVVFSSSEEFEIVFNGERSMLFSFIMSVFDVSSLFSKGCSAYLVYVIDI